MDRRETLKSLFVSSLAGGLVFQACDTKEPVKNVEKAPAGAGYGRRPEEIKRDELLNATTFFTEHELTTIAVLCDIILPTENGKGAASEAGVADFVEFIAKDIPSHQTPIRGGLMWLDNLSNTEYSKEFVSCSHDQQIAIVDRIAYPDQVGPGMAPGVRFFSLMRNLTLSGYYTSQMGIADLGYKGNTPNIWDGVPDDVLREHGMEYPAEWIPKFVDNSKREVKAEWDDQGNLLT